MSPREQRIAEIEQLAAEEGITLPWPADVIAAMEERGQYVDLVSGLTGSDQERVSLTVVGQAAAVVDRAWWDD
jgi:hypothetical protein